MNCAQSFGVSYGGAGCTPGGEQPKDVGINKAAKALGFTKEEIRRSKAIAGISAKAKEAAKTSGSTTTKMRSLRSQNCRRREAQ